MIQEGGDRDANDSANQVVERGAVIRLSLQLGSELDREIAIRLGRAAIARCDSLALLSRQVRRVATSS